MTPFKEKSNTLNERFSDFLNKELETEGKSLKEKKEIIHDMTLESFIEELRRILDEE